jgi:hypothetical protein
VFVDKILDQMKDGPVQVEAAQALKLQPGIWIQGVEGGSGPLYALVKDGQVRFSSHSMRLVKVLETLLVGLKADEADLAMASLGIDFMQADLCGSY